MYRSLNLKVLGATGRQSELLESALTHKFKGIDVDVEAVARRQTMETLPRTRQMFDSARLHMDCFPLPIDWQAEKAQFDTKMQGFGTLLDVASGLGMSYAEAIVRPDTKLPFPDDFEQHVSRIRQVADRLAEKEIRLGISFTGAPALRNAAANPFVADVEKFTALFEAINSRNVGMIVDTWDWVVSGGTLAQFKALKPESIVAVRFASLKPGVSPDAAGKDDRVLPNSDGLVNNGDFLAALAEMKFEGPVSVRPSASTLGKIGADRLVRKAKDSLDLLWIDGGLAPKPVTVVETVPPAAADDESDDDDEDSDS
ncbi:MAG: sugar phosphate isomerase/epimerase [Planctomycetales bacterium]|nr:sugar phosphate isomerase/epimerase [Planctomycetales bacterium]